MTEFPHWPRLKPPQPPSFARLINAPLKVAANALGRFEQDMNQIAGDLESIGQPLISYTPTATIQEAPVVEVPPVEAAVAEPLGEVKAVPKRQRKSAGDEIPKGTACLQCTSDHLSTLVGALNEAMRFARDGGIDQEEVQRRVHIATDELNICERIDLAPDKTAALGPKEKEVATWILPELRKLRHSLKEVGTTDDLEMIAATAALTREEYSTRYKQAKGE